MKTDTQTVERIGVVRRFNRFYTRQIGVLRKNYLDSPYSLGEMRVLYELAHPQVEAPTASDIARILDLDAGYLSRVLRNFEKRGLVKRSTSKQDARQSHLALTATGRKVFAPADERSQNDVATMLATLSDDKQTKLAGAMQTIEALLDGQSAPAAQPILRAPKHGDFGWIVTANAEIYAREYGWGDPFEGLCAGIVAEFVNKNDPSCERCWIAELNGENVGSVILVKDDAPGTARIRLLIVDPKARGMGLGQHLIDTCVTFAREAGYKKVTLWTHSVLTAARHTYARAAFTLTSSEKRHAWGQDVVSEIWDLTL